MDELEKAHEAWLKEKKEVLEELGLLAANLEMLTNLDTEPIMNAIKFIKGVKYE